MTTVPAKQHSPIPPATLTKPSATLWSQLVIEYDLRSDVTGLLLLEAALIARDRALAADKALSKEGLTVKGAAGRTLAHPCIAVSRDSWVAFNRSMRALGLEITPVESSISRPPYLPQSKGYPNGH
jgi:hypothetical protein